MGRLLCQVLERFIRFGSLRVTTADGRTFVLGNGQGPPVAVRLASHATELALLLDPDLKLGEAYVEGTLVIEQGSIADLLGLLVAQAPRAKTVPWAWPQWVGRYVLRRLAQRNPQGRARRNVSRHYDLDSRFYALFLDADRQYSCAYFESAAQSLDDAQLAKKRHIAAKLLLKPGARVLDMGCGWGGLALYLAGIAGARALGVTLSHEQLAVARARAGEVGLDGAAEFRLRDYRDLEESFERIVSVGMFEHVGVGYYDTFMRTLAARLTDDGVALLHAIGRSEGPGVTNPWIAKYIFPGGYIPALSEVLPAIERSGLLVTDIEILRLHYAETLKLWRERFMARREEAERLYDARFVRLWECYLAASEVAFRHGNMMVFQIQLAKRQDVVPMTRDYVAREEARLRRREQAGQPWRLAGE